MAKQNSKETNNYLLAIVAIVAIVGIVILIGNGAASSFSLGSNDISGQAIKISPSLSKIKMDTDKDGQINDVDSNDDNDRYSDVDETDIYGTNPLDGEDFPSDSDGDGYYNTHKDSSQIDCDEYDPTTSPGAIEYCDDIDNNCNEIIDDDCIE